MDLFIFPVNCIPSDLGGGAGLTYNKHINGESAKNSTAFWFGKREKKSRTRIYIGAFSDNSSRYNSVCLLKAIVCFSFFRLAHNKLNGDSSQ